MEFNDKKVNRLTGGAVFLISLISFLFTVSPTLSYWDCGEFITAAYTMGVPHPPGSPFFTLIGRIFSMNPLISDISLRVNLVSVMASAFSVLMLYLISVRLIKLWRGEVKNSTDAIITFGGSVIGALTFCFTYTFWFNGVEAEVYASSTFFTVFVTWLIMIWVEKNKEADASRYLLLIVFLIGLGTGVHLMNILTIPTMLFLMWFYNKRVTIITAIGMMLSVYVLFGVQPQQKIYAFFILLVLAIVFKLALKPLQDIEKNIDEDMNMVFIMPLLLLIGYSTYISIFVRAGVNPHLNMNDPSNWENFLAYLNREQYGDTPQLMNSVKFMFGDIGSRAYLESLQKMGVEQGSAKDPWGSSWSFFWNYQWMEMYIRYFNWQFIGKNLKSINDIITFNGLYGIPFLVGVWGFLHHFFKDWKKALAFTFMFIVMSLGLIIYQNQDWGQPRERDYFYVGSFFVFSIWIGIGITSIMEFLAEKNLKKMLVPVLCLGFVVPALEFNANFYESSRKGNVVAFDYSKNILETCEPNAILFTNGDNDTFPLWNLQEVFGIRTDVIIVNLSLLNTDWYIKQLRDKLPELVLYTDQEIVNNFSMHQEKMTQDGFMSRYWPKPQQLEVPSVDGKGKVQWTLAPTMEIPMQGKKEGFIKIQDQMILELVARNAILGWKRPIYFAVTVANSNYIGIDDYLRMDGLCYKITDQKTNRQIEPSILYDRIMIRYKDYYRNLGDKSVFYDENIIRLLQNYRTAFLELATYYTKDLTNSVGSSADGANADKVAAVTGMDPKKDLSFTEFEKLTPEQKISFLLNKMDYFIPADNIEYGSEYFLMQVAGLYEAIGDKKAADTLLKNVDLDKMTSKNRLQMAYYALSKNNDIFAKRIFDKEIERTANSGKLNEQIDLMLTIYSAYGQLNRAQLAIELEPKITSMLNQLAPDQKSAKYKEFAVAAHQGGMTENAVNIMKNYSKENPEDIEALQIIVELYKMLNRNQEALAILDELVKKSNNNPQIKAQRDELVKQVSAPAAVK